MWETKHIQSITHCSNEHTDIFWVFCFQFPKLSILSALLYRCPQTCMFHLCTMGWNSGQKGASRWGESRKAGEMASRPKYSCCPLTQRFSLQHIPHGSAAGENDSDREGTGEWEPHLLKHLCGTEKWKALSPALNPPFSYFLRNTSCMLAHTPLHMVFLLMDAALPPTCLSALTLTHLLLCLMPTLTCTHSHSLGCSAPPCTHMCSPPTCWDFPC